MTRRKSTNLDIVLIILHVMRRLKCLLKVSQFMSYHLTQLTICQEGKGERGSYLPDQSITDSGTSRAVHVEISTD